MSKLVIVESPAKAKTIQKYLGKGYDVIASMGHVRDLPENRLSVDVKKHFSLNILSSREKKSWWKSWKKWRIKAKPYFWLRTDREGEAISWHLSKLLDVNPEDNVRIAFHEITPPAIKEAVHHLCH